MDILKQLADTFLDWKAMGEVIPKMFAVGLPNTLVLAIISGIIGTALGMLLALMGISRNAAARWIARVYTDILRGLPPVLTILVIGFGFGPIVREFTGSTSPYPMAVAALSLMSGAYIGEIFRSGIQSVDKGQLEASRALGFGYGASMRLVVVPQGIRRVLPALVNQFIALIKESSLVFLLGLLASEREIFQIGKDAAATTGNLSPYVAAAVFYLALTIPLTHFVNWIDARLRTGRPEKKEPDEAAAVVGKGAQA
ncbi:MULTISPECIES: amino acid ABC transporter permease [Micrococcaceae]|jgi:polar amino acid transport system permease protein|uniref:amino acid ABC transporter permease n=1 Tax=Micrococcaceae TaxID=1268 RepID=UPI0006F7AE0C|nr:MULTISPECIES: amino acid ABC transporter permease [Micrococcaceae]KRE84253.1 amino acid ABC transporter permease [Arthrobacter sp. Soil764]MDQ0825071.1 polar amino acid transport system permease protein [Arthrobacter sp. B2I5]MDT0167695.1 amino acid ABC transporter permease [Pseudarthrobacter sp. BRE9]TQJ33144.1 amino acid ABC transporter membrane protein (PAAT family) [Arthrobacter sp. SLBN-122]